MLLSLREVKMKNNKTEQSAKAGKKPEETKKTSDKPAGDTSQSDTNKSDAKKTDAEPNVSAEKSKDKPTEQSAAKADKKSEGKSKDKPAEQSTKADKKSEGKSKDKPAEQATTKTDKSDKKSIEKTAEKPAEQSAKAGKKPEETKQASDKPENQVAKTADKSAEQAPAKADKKSVEKAADKSAEQGTKADKKPEEKTADKSAEQAPAKADKKPEAKTADKSAEQIKLSGLYAFKLGMSSIYDEKGRFTPVTLLQFKPWFVSQIKTQKKEGYSSVQVACKAQKNKRVSKPLIKHLTPAGFKEGAAYIKEVRQDSTENIKLGQEVSINSLEKGDIVRLTGVSKGHGFAGVVKRWNFKGGPASHGSTTHRSSGSIGNRTEPARVMPGKKMAGHYGVEQMSIRNVKVMDVVSDEKLIIVKGAVPGARNSLVYLHKNSKTEKRNRAGR